MGKKSRLKKERQLQEMPGERSRLKKEQRLQETQMYEPPLIIAELINEYLDAEVVLYEEADTTVFRNQLATSDSLHNCLQNEVKRLGIDEEEFAIAYTHIVNTMINAPPDDLSKP